MTTIFLSTALMFSTAPPVTAVAYAPDGTILAAGVHRQVALIDSNTGDVTRRIDLPTRVTALTFLPDGKTLAIGVGRPAKSGEIYLVGLDAPSVPPRIIAAHADAVYGLAANANILATGSYDKHVKIWDPATGRELHTLKDHSDSVYGVAIQPGGHLVASVAADRAVKIWDTQAGRRLYSLTDATDWLYAVAFSPDGKRLAAGGIDKSIRVWEVDSKEGKLLAAFFAHNGPVLGLAFTRDGKSLVSLSADRSIKVWDPHKGQERRQFERLPAEPTAFALRPDGRQLAVARHDGVLTIHDFATGKILHTPLPEKPKPPRIVTIEPSALPRNVTMNALLRGERLDKATDLVCGTAGIAIEIVRQEPMQLEARLTIPATIEPGVVTIIAKSVAGDSMPIDLNVDAFPSVPERGNTDAGAGAQSMTLDTTIAGAIDRAGDVDYYQIQLQAGQEVGTVVTRPTGSKVVPAITWMDSGGQVLAEGESATGFAAPAAGNYTLMVRDRDYRGGPAFGYRLHVGRLPVVTGIFPLTLPRGAKQDVEIRGVYLDSARVNVAVPRDAALDSKVTVPVTSKLGPVAGTPTLSVSEQSALTTNGPTLPVPGAAEGRLSDGSSNWHFAAKKGQPLIVEALARRYGSPLDPTLEILTADGRPIERARLRCMAKTVTVLRDHPADSPVLRLETWNEFATDDYVWVGNEVMRISELPGHPDADCDFYAVNGKKRTYFDTTGSWHPLGASVFKVQVHPPGAKLADNGFPIVPLYYRNDDGGPGYGKDARVTFDPPADGIYQARVSDASGRRGDLYAYRLVVRPPHPAFTVRADQNAPAVERGGARSINVTVDRKDRYEGPVDLRIDGLPPGFTCPPTRIETGQTKATMALAAGADAAAPGDGELTIIGTAEIAGAAVTSTALIGRPKLIEPGDIITRAEQPNVSIRPGSEATLLVRVERRNGFAGRIPMEVRGLPHGVRVLHIGLNGIMITEKETTRTIHLYAEPWVEPTEMPILVVAKREGANTEHAAPPLPIVVGK